MRNKKVNIIRNLYFELDIKDVAAILVSITTRKYFMLINVIKVRKSN